MRRHGTRSGLTRPPATATAVDPAADVPLGGVLERHLHPLPPDAFAVSRAALADKTLSLEQKRPFAKDILDGADKRAPRKVEPGGGDQPVAIVFAGNIDPTGFRQAAKA